MVRTRATEDAYLMFNRTGVNDEVTDAEEDGTADPRAPPNLTRWGK